MPATGFGYATRQARAPVVGHLRSKVVVRSDEGASSSFKSAAVVRHAHAMIVVKVHMGPHHLVALAPVRVKVHWPALIDVLAAHFIEGPARCSRTGVARDTTTRRLVVLVMHRRVGANCHTDGVAEREQNQPLLPEAGRHRSRSLSMACSPR